MPSYPEIRLALAAGRAMSSGGLSAIRPDAIHVATEGPIGHAMRRSACGAACPSPPAFTPDFPTILPSDCRCRSDGPARRPGRGFAASMRRRAAVMAATPTLASELATRGFKNVKLWPRGVDCRSVSPARQRQSQFAAADFLTVGRLAVEKNLESFLEARSAGHQGGRRRRPGAPRVGAEVSGCGFYRAASR